MNTKINWYFGVVSVMIVVGTIGATINHGIVRGIVCAIIAIPVLTVMGFVAYVEHKEKKGSSR